MNSEPVVDLRGRSALVTGSTQGIGRGIAETLVQAGAAVAFHGLEASDEVRPICLVENLLEAEGPGRLVEAAFGALPGLDILVCNAGSFFDVPFLDMTGELWERTVALNMRAPYFLIQAFARRLVEQGRGGSVVLVSSTNGYQAEPDSTAYDTSKGALVMMVRTLAVSLAPHGIRVNGLAPGVIRTPLTARWLDVQPEMRAHYENNIPLGRIGMPADCGGVAAFLASDAAVYITGQTIIVDGGLTALQIGPL